MEELGQQTVDFSKLVKHAVEESYLLLSELVEKGRSASDGKIDDRSDSEKKIDLLKFVNKTRQRMLRLNVVAKWCQQIPLVQRAQQLQSTLSCHDTCFTQAADTLFFMHDGLQQARAPIYDVPSAVEVLLTGTYQRIPKCIEDIGAGSSLSDGTQKTALRKLDSLVRSKLLELTMPKEFSEIKVTKGTVLLRVNGEFKVLVTLGYRGHLSMWRILHIDLLVGERSGPVKLEKTRRLALGDDLERRMSVGDNPFFVLFAVLHELCVALVMDTVIRQVQGLRLGRWKDAIRFDLTTDGNNGPTLLNQDGEADSSGMKTPGVKISYWLDIEKNSDSMSSPFLKIEPGPDLQISCTHSTFIIDPLKGKEAVLVLDQGCIDIEKLLLRAICCHRYTRLFEIFKDLEKNLQINRTMGDVLLHQSFDVAANGINKDENKNCGSECEASEVLHVRAYGSAYFTLGINLRNGRFLLRMSRNILAHSLMIECEEALNHGTLSAPDVFCNLRSKSILHLFASIGKFLGLEVYEHSFAASKVPKSMHNGCPMLLMGFPDCGSSYFLLLQLDKDFKPLFKMLESHTDELGKDHTSNELTEFVRFIKIDISQMQLVDDDLNLSDLDRGKSANLLPNTCEKIFEHDALSEMRPSSSPGSNFSSIVDEVFQLEKGVSSYSSNSFIGTSQMNSATGKAVKAFSSWEGDRVAQRPGASMPYNSSIYDSNYPVASTSLSSFSSVGPEVAGSAKRMTFSKSDMDLASLRSPNLGEVDSFGSIHDDHHLRLLNDSRDAVSLSQLLSSSQQLGSRVNSANDRLNGFNSASGGHPKASVSLPCTPLPHQIADTVEHNNSVASVSVTTSNARKRKLSDVLNLIPTLNNVKAKLEPRIGLSNFELICSKGGYNYGSLVAEAYKGNAPSSIYVTSLLNVVRHCSLCIKYARLTSQMDALDIPYVEEVGLRSASSNIWFKLPFARFDSCHHMCLRLGKPGSMHWDVKINDQHFRDLWELQKGSGNTNWGCGVRIANTSDVDSHIRYDPEGVVLSYQSVEADSMKKLVADIRRLCYARMFAQGMRKLLGIRSEDKSDDNNTNSENRMQIGKSGTEASEKLLEQLRRIFKIEAVGLMSFWFSFGSGVLARFVVEWESGKEGCTMHVLPDQLWPHTKFLEEFINGGEVESLLDCIRLTAGPLHALAAATRPARAGPTPPLPTVAASSSLPKQAASAAASAITSPSGLLGNHNIQAAGMLATGNRGGPGIVPSSLLPIDVSVVLRGPYWIRIIYRKHFAVDMRCFAGDQVWLQPATPPKGGPSVGGSLPCPQFRPFIMEHVAQELNGLDPSFSSTQQMAALVNSGALSSSSATNGNRVSFPASSPSARNIPNQGGLNRVASSNLIRRSPAGSVPAHVRGELNTAIIGLGDDGGYGGGWVPLVALKKVLRGILKYLGVLWLFAQLPDLLKEILGSILKENEGALLNLDQEQPALRFFVGGYVFAVSVHRVQLLLQVLSVRRFHNQPQQQPPQHPPPPPAQEELTQPEIGEICDYFSRRVASEPYDASRVASFITLLTLPISVLREFLKLIAWKKGLSQSQTGGEPPSGQKPRIELCLENHAVDMPGTSAVAKSNVAYDRPHSAVDFALTLILDPAHIPHVNSAGGAAWLPYCVSVRLRYSFNTEVNTVSLIGIEGSHGGRACWGRADDWEKCKQLVARTVDVSGSSSPADVSQGKLKMVADSVQRTLNMCLQGLRDGDAL